MIIKLNFCCFVLMLLNAFMSNKYFSFHFICILIAIKLSKMQRHNYDYYYILLLWLYKLILIIFIKKNVILWSIYDIICIFISIYYLSRALKFLFCK